MLRGIGRFDQNIFFLFVQSYSNIHLSLVLEVMLHQRLEFCVCVARLVQYGVVFFRCPYIVSSDLVLCFCASALVNPGYVAKIPASIALHHVFMLGLNQNFR